MRRRYEAASVLGRWLTWVFWLCIGSNTADLIFIFMGLQMDITLTKSICSLAFQALNILALFKLGEASDRFRLSAIMTIVVWALTLVGTMIEHQFLALIVSLGSTSIAIVSEYQQFIGFVEVTEEADSELSNKWSNLWTAYFICLCTTLVGALLTAMGIAIAWLIAFAAASGLIVAAVFKIVYLYRTGVLFRNLSKELQYWHLMS